jgi:hypothetical protein
MPGFLGIQPLLSPGCNSASSSMSTALFGLAVFIGEFEC